MFSHLGMVKWSRGVPEGFRGSRTGESDSVFIILHSCVWALVVELLELCLSWRNVWVSWWSAFKRCMGYGENGEAEAAGVVR